MAHLTFKGQPANTVGNLPTKGQKVSASDLVKADLSEASLEDYKGERKILNIFPSIDTGICATSVRKFNEIASKEASVKVLNIAVDLPFAMTRFCGAEGIKNVEVLSAFRSSMGQDWGLTLKDTPLKGVLARAIFVLSEDNTILHSELVADIVQEPNYDAALSALKA